MHKNVEHAFTMATKFVQYKQQKVKTSLLSNNHTLKLCQQNLSTLQRYLFSSDVIKDSSETLLTCI